MRLVVLRALVAQLRRGPVNRISGGSISGEDRAAHVGKQIDTLTLR